MVKNHIIASLLLLISISNKAQELHFGLGVNAPLTSLTLKDQTIRFPDNNNTVYEIKGDQFNLNTNQVLNFDLYAANWFNSKWGISTHITYAPYTTDLVYNVSNKISEPVESKHLMFYDFIQNDLSLLYKFYHKKELKPSLKLGLNYWRLLAIKEITNVPEGKLLKNNEPYGKVLLHELNELNSNLLLAHIGCQIDYYNFLLSYQYSLALNNIGDSYENLSSHQLTVNLRLFSSYVNSKSIIKKL